MKKTSAVIAVTTLGVASAAAGAAAPAIADPVTTPCADISAHVLADPLPDNWYMPCVPQYGLGKAEFTIESTTDFPDEFLSLDDDGVTTTSTVDEAVIGAYVQVGGPLPMVSPVSLLSPTPTTQTYLAQLVAPVTGVGVVAPVDLPVEIVAQCDPTGWTTPIYRATYGSLSTTFAQTINGVPWNFTVTGNPPPTYFFLQFDPTAVGDPISGDFPQVAPDSPFCVTDGVHTLSGIADDSGGIPIREIMSVHAGLVPPFAMLLPSEFINPSGENVPLQDLGTFALAAPAAPAAPQLAATGTDATPYLVAAGALGGVGVLLSLLGYRRRRAAKLMAD